MRRLDLFLAVLLCFLGPCAAYPAWQFNGTNATVSLADNAALDLPDADWAILINFQLSSTAWPGIDVNLYEHATGASAKIQIAMYSYNSSTIQEIYVVATDNDGTTITIDQDPGGNWTSDTNEHSLLVQREGNTITIYLDGTALDSVTDANFDGVSPAATLYIGSRGGSSHFFPGKISGIAIWSKSFGAADRLNIGKVFSALCYPGMNMYLPAVGEYRELIKAIAVTNTNTTITAHPRMYSCN